jgi:hypothetical protein
VAPSILIKLGDGNLGPSLFPEHPFQYAKLEIPNATIDKGQYNGILNKIIDTIKSINETTGKTYCNKKKQAKSNFLKLDKRFEINNGQ